MQFFSLLKIVCYSSSYLGVGSARSQYNQVLVEPIIRCINAFYDNSNIVRYFVTLLGIVCSDNSINDLFI